MSATPDRTRILIVDDHVLLRDGLRRLLQSQKDMEVVGEAGDSTAAVAVAVREQPDIVLLDIEMPGGNVSATVRELRESSPRSGVIASLLSLKEATVKRHLRNIFVKLGAVSRIDAVNKAAELRVHFKSPRTAVNPRFAGERPSVKRSFRAP